MNWTCTVCNITIQSQNRKPHLSGKRHAEATAATATVTQIPIPQVTRTQQPRGRWTCLVCNIEMELDSQFPHLAGKKHAAAVQSRAAPPLPEPKDAAGSSSRTASMFSADSGVSGITENTIYAPSDLAEVQGVPAVMVWQCMMCGCYVPMSSRQAHLCSAEHVKNLMDEMNSTLTAMLLSQPRVLEDEMGGREGSSYQVT